MSDFTSVLLGAELDTDKSVVDINKQIKNLSKKLDPIKVKTIIDDKELGNINKLNKQLSSFKNEVKNIDLNLNDKIKLNNTNGQLDKLKIIKDNIKETTTYVSELTNKEKERLRITQNQIGETIKLEKTKNYKKEMQELQKVIDFQEKYLTKAKELSKTGIVPEKLIKDFEGLTKLLNVGDSKADFDLIKSEYKKLSDLQKDLLANEKEIHKENIKSYQEELQNKKIIFQYEKKLKDFKFSLNKSKIDSSSAEYNKLQDTYKNITQTIEQYKNSKKTITDDEKLEVDKQIDNLNRLKKTYEEVAKERIRIKKLGERTGSIKGVDFKDNEAIKKYILSLQEAGAEITKFKRTTDSLGNSQIKMKVSSKHGTDMLKQQQLVIDENTQSIYKYDESLKPVPGRLFDWANAMKTAMVRSVQWAIAMELLYGNLRKLREGIQYIQDLEHETQQIQMVTKMTTEQVNELTRSYSKLADELGSTTLDITKSATEFFRQGLNIDEVQDRVENVGKLSTVLGLSMEETAEKVTAGVNSMGVETERLGDVVTKVGAIAGTSGEEILTIIQRAGATAKQSGVSLEELASVGAVISEQTRLSAETIGTALNTIFAKFQQVDDLTGEINEDYGKVIQAVENVGINAIDKTTGQLRNVMDILNDVGAKWNQLSKKQQQYITSAMGVRQFNRFATLLQNSTRQMEILAEAQNSQNEMTEQHAIYLQKTEAAAERAKNALQKMWNNTIQSQSLKRLYDISTAIINIVDKIGVLRAAFTALGVILLLSNKKYRSFLGLLKESATEMGLVEGSVFSLKTALEILSQKFTLAGIKATATKVAIASLQAALTLGLSIAISSVIQWIDKLIHRYDYLKTANQELVMSYKQNVQANNSSIERLQSLSNKYDVIKDKIKNQIELNDEERQTISELVAINPSLVQGYDERGNAIIDTTQNIEDMIDTLKRANELEKIKLFLSGQDLFEEAQHDVKNIQEDIKKINQQIENIKFGKDLGTSIFSGKTIKTTTNSLKYLKEKYEEVAKAQSENSDEAIKLNQKIKEKELLLHNLNGKIQVYQQKQEASTIEVKNAILAYVTMTDTYKNLDTEIKSFIHNFVKAQDIMDFKDIDKFQAAVNELMDALNNKEVQDAVHAYKDLVEQFKNNKISAEEFDKELENIIKTFENIDNMPDDIISKFFKDSSEIDDVNNKFDDAANQAYILETKMSDLNQEFEQTAQDVSELNQLIDDYNNQKEISATRLNELIIKYPELTKAITEEGGQLKINLDIVKDVRDTKTNAFNLSLQQYESEVTAHANATIAKLNNYGLEIEAIRNVADARKALGGIIEKQNEIDITPFYLKSDKAKKMWRGKVASSPLITLSEQEANERQYKALSQAESQMDNIISAYEQIEALKNMVGTGFKGVPGKEKSKKPKSKKKKSPYKSQISMFRELKDKIEDTEHEIERYNKLIDNTASEEKRMKYLNKTVILYKQQQSQLHKLNNELKYNRNIIGKKAAKQLSDVFTFDDKTGKLNRNIKVYNQLSDTRKKAADYYIKIIDDLNDEITSNSLKWWDVNKSLQDDSFKRISYNANKSKNKISELNLELEKSNFTLQQFDEVSKQYYNEQNRQLKILEKQRDIYNELLQYYQKQLQTQTLNIEQKQQLSDEMLSTQQTLLDLNSQIFSIQKSQKDIFKNLLDETESELKSIKDSLEDLEKQRAFEKLQNDIKETTLTLEPFANELGLLETKFSLLDDIDYEGKIDVVAQQFKAGKKYGRQLRKEFDRLSKTNTNNSQETDALISALTDLQQKIKQNTLDTIEYQKTLDNLRIEQIATKFNNVNQALERELSLVDHNLKMLEGGLLSGTDIVFGVDFALPTIPEDLIEKKRKENEDLLNEQEKYEEDIQDLQELSLEQQRKEQERHYNESMAELIKHYDEVIDKIKDYLGIELDTQKDHQFDVNEAILDGLTTTADNYNNTWSGIVQNLRGYLSEIERMVDQTNRKINSIGGSSKGKKGSKTRTSGTYKIGTRRGKDVYSAGGMFSDGAYVRDDGLIQKGNKVLKPKFHAEGTKYHNGEISLVGEEGEELGILPNGKTVMLGKNGAELVDIPEGTQVVPHEETREILSYTGNVDDEIIPKYKSGTLSAKEIEENAIENWPLRKGGRRSPLFKYLLPNGDVYKIEKRLDRDGNVENERVSFVENIVDNYYTYEDSNWDRIYKNFVDSGKVSKNFEMPWEKTQRAKDQGYFTEEGLKSQDDFFTELVSKKHNNPIFMLNGDFYTEVEDGIYQDAGSIYDEKYDKDDEIRILFGDILESNYPDSIYLDNHNKMMDYIATEIPENASIRQKATGTTHMGGYDESLPEDFQQYREKRTTAVEQIQKDQQKIIEDIAKGLDVSELKEDVLNRIDEQLQKDVEMQFRLQEDTLRQQIENAYEYMTDLEDKYLEAINDEDLYMANKLSDQYNEAADIYLRTQEKLKNAVKDRYEYEFSLIDKKTNKETEVQDTYRKQLDILKELNKHNYDGFIQCNEAILQSENNKLALLQQSSKELQSQLNSLEVGSYEWNIVNDRLDKVNSSIQDTTLSIIKQNKEVLRQRYERDLHNIEKDLFDGKTSDEARKELNDKIKYQNEYVGGLEKELIVSKILSDARKNNVKLTKKELALLNQSGNIERVKLERLQKQLNIRQLEQKLSNLQNQKTIQQLTKQADGTWDFTYSVDEDAVYNAERELKEAKLDLIKWERDLENTKKQEEIDAKSRYLDELRKLTEKSLQGEYQSLSQFYTDANKITNEFYGEFGNSVHTAVDSLANDFNIFLDTLDNFKSSTETYDIPENSILGIVGEDSIVQQANDTINELLEIQDKALVGQYDSFNEFINDIQSLGDRLNEVYKLIWDSVVEKQLSSNDTLKMAYDDLLLYYKDYVFDMSDNTEQLTQTIVDSSAIIEDAINFMTEIVGYMVVKAKKASFNALESAETAAQAMISAIESARGASQAASDAAKSAKQAAISTSGIADKIQTIQPTQFDTGGYTGSFKNGKLAVLHEKELVLNKADTSNLLKAVNVTRDLFSNIKMPTMPKMQPVTATNNGEQTIHNHIDRIVFPDVKKASEIEKALQNIPNKIIQKIK